MGTPLQARREPLRLLTLVIPVRDERDVLPLLRERLTAWRARVPYATEVVLVDDGSRDGSHALLASWASSDPSVRVLTHPEPEGQQRAMLAGLGAMRGEAAVLMDADLQDPPEVIPDFVKAYEAGHAMAYGVRSAREGEPRWRRAGAWLFYRIARQASRGRLPVDTGDFRLVSREAVEAVKRDPEAPRYLRGAFHRLDLPSIAVPYARHPRAAGRSKYGLGALLRVALEALGAARR